MKKNIESKKGMGRREYLKKTALGSVGLIFVPTIVPSSVFGKDATSNKINIGKIGCGRIAKDHDTASTLKYDQARIIAVCDLDSNRALDSKNRIEGHYGKGKVEVKMYEDYREMLINPDIDAVQISTPDHWHSQPAIEAALAGKDIYLQKPTSLTVAEGRLLSDIVNKQGVILQVGTQQRSSPQFRIAAEFVRNGRIGKIHTVKV